MMFFYSVKWFHDLFDFNSVSDSKLISSVLEAAKRKLSKPVKKKEPVTIELLTKMYESIYKEGDVKQQRTICVCLLAYAGFMKSAEILNLRTCDVLINPVYTSVFIESSKTAKYRDGAWIVIARTGTMCPVINLEVTSFGLIQTMILMCIYFLI